MCQKYQANPTYGNHPREGVNRVMVSFCKFKQVNARDNYMQVYNNQYIDNCILIKEQGRENANTRVYSDSVQPGLHPLSSSFNLKVEVPLILGFQTKPSSNTIGLWFQSPSWTFDSKHPLHFSRDIPLLNNFLSRIYK